MIETPWYLESSEIELDMTAGATDRGYFHELHDNISADGRSQFWQVAGLPSPQEIPSRCNSQFRVARQHVEIGIVVENRRTGPNCHGANQAIDQLAHRPASLATDSV